MNRVLVHVMMKARFIKQVLAHMGAATSITVNLLPSQRDSLVIQRMVEREHTWVVLISIQSKL